MCTANQGQCSASGIFIFLLSVIKSNKDNFTLLINCLYLIQPHAHLRPGDTSRHANKMSSLTNSPNGRSTIDAKALLGVCLGTLHVVDNADISNIGIPQTITVKATEDKDAYSRVIVSLDRDCSIVVCLRAPWPRPNNYCPCPPNGVLWCVYRGTIDPLSQHNSATKSSGTSSLAKSHHYALGMMTSCRQQQLSATYLTYHSSSPFKILYILHQWPSLLARVQPNKLELQFAPVWYP